MKTRYVKTALSGGGATALDGIVITTPLLTDDFAFVVVGNVATMYNFDAASNEAESLPDIVNPDGNGGAGRWILQNLRSTGFTGTSATSLLIEVASKTLTVQANKAFVIGMSVKIADSAAPGTNWMHGDVTSYTASTGVLIVNVTAIQGSGTLTAWTVSLSAPFTLQTDITGNAATATLAANATKLAATKTIGGIAFDGSANITVASATGGFAVTGALTATGNITAYYSSLRLKENIIPIDDALNKVCALRGVYFNPNDLAATFGYTDKSRDVGVIAEEVKQVLPEATALAPFDTNPDGTSKTGENYLTVRYERLVPLLIEAIKTLSQKVERLEAKQ